ncbi:MAG: outer membrane beta-barrel protein [Prevotella sp.]|nr:outer membrane beta-barrel protein [Prevotella sp.]
MKKRILAASISLLLSASSFAGGLMTNTNYHVAFDRMMARGATFEIDAAYSNPAGMAWTKEGWQLSLNFQKPWQNRDIELDGTKYEGKASAPIVPALFAAYKHDRWALSAMIGIVGSGGSVEYDNGVPMFNVLLGSTITAVTKGLSDATQGFAPVVTPDAFDSKMKGKQYIYGGQVNFTYKILDCLSAAAGIRVNYYDGYYRGHVIANHSTIGNLANLSLDVDQKGWGVAPLIGINFHKGKLTLAAKYEFRTKINTENKTNSLNASFNSADLVEAPLAQLVAMGAMTPQAAIATASQIKTTVESGLATYTAPYQDGVKTRYDMPALLSVAAGYEFTPKLRATIEYHFFDDKNAKMANDRQNELTHGTHEILAGVEYDINDKFTVSCGGQRTDYGLSDGYQQNTSFACDSYSIGMGGAWNINEKLRLNAGYFISLYSDYKKQTSYGVETYSRTNNVIGVGIDYHF